jgi:hypothetical protein
MVTKLTIVGTVLDVYQDGLIVRRTHYSSRMSALRRAITIVARMVGAGLDATIGRVA